MILYIDETENQDYFIVAGLLTESQLVVDNSFRHLKNRINKLNYKAKDKNEIFLEFKGHVLDRKFQKVKFEMLDEINKLDEVIYYSCYIKKEKSLKQSIKEKEYIRMLEKIVSNIADDIDIIFDNFNKKDFEMKIVERIGSKDNVRSIKPMNSQLEAGLKYVDNICSVIRLHLSDHDEYIFYSFIKDKVINVD